MPMYQKDNMSTFLRSLVIALGLLLNTTSMMAIELPKFDPQKWQADMEQYIVMCAALTPQEAVKFFPIYREWKTKERAIFMQRRRFRHVDTSDNRASAEFIRTQDEFDIQMKKLQQTYHNKFMRILPAGKVMEIIKAEDQFHRNAFRRIMEKR